jgi:hypothetical protein
VVTVWLVSGDVLAGTSPATYATGIHSLLGTLRNGGRTEVLVGNAPPAAQLPGLVACQAGGGRRNLRCPATLPDATTVDATVASYNAAIAAAAADTGAVLVDLHAAVASAVAGGKAAVLDPTGADLSTAGSTVVARAFSTALHRGAAADTRR